MDAPSSLDFSSLAPLLSMDQKKAFSSPSDGSEYKNSALEYISQVLMEEDVEEQPCMSRDALALQATEKSLYDVLGEKYPSAEQIQIPACPSRRAESSDNSVTSSGQDSSDSSSFSISSSIDPPCNGVNSPFYLETQTPAPANGNKVVGSSALEYISQVLMEEDVEEQPCMFRDALALQATEKSLYDVLGDYQVLRSSVSDIVSPNCFHQTEWALQFNKGVQEASKFLPKFNHLTTALENPASVYESETDVRPGLEEREVVAPSHLTGKKNCEKGEDDELEEGRKNKQPAVSTDEDQLSVLFDKLLLHSSIEQPTPRCILYQSLPRASKALEQKEQTNGYHGGNVLTRRKRDREEEMIDLRALLISCSQALSTNDLRAANDLLKRIRQHSLCIGDKNQRLAHVFADALEARIAGTGNQIYATLCSKRKSAADVLKAYQLYLLACPFQRSGIFFSNRTIMEFVKEKKATTLHIIDFGILHGFHWPPLIMRFQQKIRGPLKLRITGIDFPTSSSPPTDVVQETGSRLARYCKIFNVPFEYNCIAQKWETIRVEDLNLRPNEVVVVNCLYRLHNLLDDTIVENNPRDAVLNLIRKINPDMFINSIVNGSYRNPFFPPRFKDAFFHYSALFDVCDSNISGDDEMRLILEQEIFGKEIMNVVACEGAERIERAESYKQWQARTMRAGFRQRPLDSELLSTVRGWVKDDFKDHDNFMVETDGEWMLQGWKGKILFASSVWIPT